MSSSDESTQPRHHRLGPALVVGLVVLALALCGIGWAGYQLLATNVVARHAYATEAAQLRTQWQQPGAAKPGEAIGLLRVPRFGATYEVPILNGTDLDTLEQGVGHYSDTSMPGQVGNFALAGYRVTRGQPFAKLLDLDRGDEVVVETRTAVYTYVIDQPPRSLTVNSAASWVLDPVPGQPRQSAMSALITLTTGQDLLPSADRAVGFGHLASTKNKG